MSELILHQLVHGYAHGHSLLAASTQLERHDMDLVARLSDLSGTLGPELEITPYLSLYPLPSRKFFAVARTWPDESASRAGCVLTHTILIPLKTWAEDDSPIRFAAALRAPSKDALANYAVPVRSMPDVSGHCAASEPFGNSFIQRYFGEGLTPLVWFGARDPESAAWCVIRALWPSLRESFACCTLALQPRTLNERPFDLVFALPPCFSRFSEFARDHIIDGRASLDNGATEPWFRSWSSCLFEGSPAALCDRVRVLSSELEPYPTAIRTVMFFLELEERATSSPTAAVGALDLLEKLAPQPSRASEEKSALAVTALHAIDRLPPHEALELLYLLCERLQGASFRSHHGLQEQISDLVQQLIKADPEHGVEDANSLTARHADAAPPLFMLGVADALIALLGSQSSTASMLIENSTLGERLIAYRPEVAAALLRAVGPLDRDRVISALVCWCRAEQATGVRPALRRSLLPEVASPADAPLVEELLRDLGGDDVPQVCDVVERLDAFRSRPLSALVSRLVGEQHPSTVRQWSRTHPWDSFQTAVLITAGYPATADGLNELSNAETRSAANRSLLLAAFVERVSKFSPPGWLVSLLETDFRLWERLLTGVGNQEVADVVASLVRGLKRSAIARVPHADQVLGGFGGKNIMSLREHALRQLLADHLEGFCDVGKLQRWCSESWVIDTLASTSAGTIRAMFADQLRRSPTSWPHAWEVVESIPAVVAVKNADLVYEIIAVLLQSRSDQWSALSAMSWRTLLSKVSWGDRAQIDLCSQALHFALEHRHLPLGEVVAETFYPVHDAAMKDRSQRRSWGLWGFHQWDKAGDLRRSLVDSFLHSDWDPSQFALSAREPWLLRKLCKRMLRQWEGSKYLEDAYSRLKKIPGPTAEELASVLYQILQDPDVIEEWD